MTTATEPFTNQPAQWADALLPVIREYIDSRRFDLAHAAIECANGLHRLQREADVVDAEVVDNRVEELRQMLGEVLEYRDELRTQHQFTVPCARVAERLTRIFEVE